MHRRSLYACERHRPRCAMFLAQSVQRGKNCLHTQINEFTIRWFRASIPPRSPSFDRKTLIFFALRISLIGISFAPKTEIVIFTCGTTWNVKLHLNLIFHSMFFIFTFLSFFVHHIRLGVQFYLFTLQHFPSRYRHAKKMAIRCFDGTRDNPLIFLPRFDIITSPNCRKKSAFNCSIIQPNLVPPLRYYNEIVQSEAKTRTQRSKLHGASSLLFIY